MASRPVAAIGGGCCGQARRSMEQRPAGADRALAVVAAIRLMPAGSAGTGRLVRDRHHRGTNHGDGVWQGGAIAPGLGLAGRALHLRTAHLPLDRASSATRRGLGASTRPGSGSRHLLGSRRYACASCLPPDQRSEWRPLGHLDRRRCCAPGRFSRRCECMDRAGSRSARAGPAG